MPQPSGITILVRHFNKQVPGTSSLTSAMVSSKVPFSLLLVLGFLLCCGQVSARRRLRPAAAAQFLRSQNAARAAVGLPPLSWDVRLARYAAAYAGTRRWDCALVHSGGPYGENIFWGSGARWRPAQAAAAWVGERRWYHYGSNSCSGRQCGHYTQIVWRSTRRLGCAMVDCAARRGVFAVCEYDPPGNYIGERPY